MLVPLHVKNDITVSREGLERREEQENELVVVV
jgi:hypothetical protein